MTYGINDLVHFYLSDWVDQFEDAQKWVVILDSATSLNPWQRYIAGSSHRVETMW